MSQTSPQELVDILTLDSVTNSIGIFIWLILFSVFLFLLAIAFFIRYRKQPVGFLRRQLLSRQLSVRQTAHLVPKLVKLNSVQMTQLDKFRFDKVEPTQQQLLDFLLHIESL